MLYLILSLPSLFLRLTPKIAFLNSPHWGPHAKSENPTRRWWWLCLVTCELGMCEISGSREMKSPRSKPQQSKGASSYSTALILLSPPRVSSQFSTRIAMACLFLPIAKPALRTHNGWHNFQAWEKWTTHSHKTKKAHWAVKKWEN